MKKLEYKKFELKSIDYNQENKEMIIKGYAATFGNQDTKQMTWHSDLRDYIMACDTIEKGAFTKTLSERKSRIAFCKNHNIEDAKGKIKDIREDEYGLFVEIRISDAEQELKTKISEDIYNEFSIGFVTLQSTFEKQLDGTYNRKLLELKLYEVSIVTIARDENAKITEIKSIELINNLIDSEKNEEKKYKLMQIKSLFENEPNKSLDDKKPKNDIDFNKFNFINN